MCLFQLQLLERCDISLVKEGVDIFECFIPGGFNLLASYRTKEIASAVYGCIRDISIVPVIKCYRNIHIINNFIFISFLC
jgi:hypothetical protein